VELEAIIAEKVFTDDSDEVLVERVKEGSQEAYTELVRRYMKKAYSIAYQFVGNSEDAKDISQDVFVKIYQSIGRFKQGHKFFSWFYRILVNHCINVRKKISISPFAVEDLSRYPGSADDSIEAAIDKHELHDNVHQAIAKLPLKQRKVLILCEIEGFSQQKVSDIMGISEGTVRSRLFYARKKLQKHLKKYVGQ